MLEPNNRSLLTDLLQPPRGFQLEQAVGTSFTLDLASALTVPLAFASRSDVETEDIGIISALTQHAEKVTIFSQSGAIKPGIRSDLVALLEDVLYPVHLKSGLFHPKVWALEYASGNERRYRLLCLSRNLTEDQSWDLQVRLDGKPAEGDRRLATAERNGPLTAFLKQLPRWSVNEVPSARVKRIHTFADRIAGVQWEHPQGVTDVAFHLLGRKQDYEPADQEQVTNVQRMLNVPSRQTVIISPFVSEGGLRLIPQDPHRETVLITRAESLDRLPAQVARPNLTTKVLDEYFAQEETSDDQALSGLHAKAVFMTHRSKTSQGRAYLGSANVTDGGLNRNVEFMVELRGHPRDIGPESVLRDLGEYLIDYPIGEEAAGDLNEEATAHLEAQLRHLASHHFIGRIVHEPAHGIQVWCEEEAQAVLEAWELKGIEVSWKPVTLTKGFLPLRASDDETNPVQELQETDVTPFIMLKLQKTVEGQQISAETVVQAQILNDNPDRVDRILASHIGDGETFMKLLLMLLDPTGAESQLLVNMEQSEGSSWGIDELSRGLFESLLRSLARGDDGLETAQRILTEIRRIREDQELQLPQGFTELWDNVWKARSAMMGGKR